MLPLCPSEIEMMSLFHFHRPPAIDSPTGEPSAVRAVPSMVKEWGGDDTVLCLQDRFRDVHGWSLCLRIWPSRQEGFGILQTHPGRVDTT